MIINLTGQRFARMSVLRRASEKKDNSRAAYWHCVCDCGQEKIVSGSSLRNGSTKSCGCLRNELSGDRFSARSKLPVPWLSSRNNLIRRYRNRAKEDDRVFSLTDEECHALFKGTCVYCGENPTNSINSYFNKKGERLDRKSHRQTPFRFDLNTATYLFNGIDRIDNTIDYLPNNCVSCCMVCNRAKSDMTTAEWQGYLLNLANFRSDADILPISSKPLAELTHQRVSFNRLVASYTRSAEKRDLTFELSLEECHRLFQGKCSYCGEMPSNTINNCLKKDGSPKQGTNCSVGALYTYAYNGIDRKDSGLGYLNNGQCVSCCLTCNVAKGNLSTKEFEAWIARVITHQKQKLAISLEISTL